MNLQEEDHKKALLVSRKKKSDDTVITIKGETIGAEKPQFVFGPCSVESYEQVAAVAESLKQKDLSFFAAVRINLEHPLMTSKDLD